jgi:alpha 1,2-mannosyltransferase
MYHINARWKKNVNRSQIMTRPRQQFRRRNIFIALGLVVIVTWLLSGSQSPQSGVVTTTGHEQFWVDFYPLLIAAAPNCDAPSRIANAESVGFDPENTQPVANLLQMTDENVMKMKQAHSTFVKSVRQDPPPLHYKPGTKGLVSTAGPSYMPVLVISLRMLRRTGSELPMEVFLADWTEYDGYTCQVVLPSLNAQCVVLSDILDAVPGSREKVAKYQYKPLAMLFSSFEEILFLDADAFPLQKPESIFASEPFRSRGLVTFPDFWGPTASPLFYQIASLEQPAPNIRQSTESGEVFVSKRTHLRTLLLCAYYNFWGPSYYYPLLSQGAAGEGDKETFLAAATVLNEPFYQVSEPIRAVGRHKADGFSGSTMVQYNPIEDYALTRKGEWRIRGSAAPAPSPFIIHANFPKFNPATIFHENGPVIKEDGSYTRAWLAPEDVIEASGTDVERHFWEEIRWTACALEGKTTSWEGKKGICDRTVEYWNQTFG